MRTLEETLDLVEAQTTKVDSLIVLTNNLHQKVLDALGSGLTPSQQMRVDAVFDEVTSEAGKVDAALTANTVQATAGAVSAGPSAADLKNMGGASQAPANPPAAPDPAAPAPVPPIGSSA